MRPLLLLCLCLPLLAGCFGYPEGAALPGDSVAVEVTVRDLLTDEVLARNQTLVWQVGDGRTGLGPRLDQAVRGLPVNGTFRFEIAGEGRLGAPREVRLPATLPATNLTERVTAAEYRAALGRDAQVGHQVRFTPPLPGLFRGYAPSYLANVTEATNETVVFRLNATDERTRVPQTTIQVHAWADGDLLRRELVATAGDTFAVRAPPGQPTPFDLPAGAYAVRSADGATIVLGHNPDIDVPALLRDVRVEGKVLAVAPRAHDPVDVVRDSPVLDGGARATATASPTPTPADDGHDHQH